MTRGDVKAMLKDTYKEKEKRLQVDEKNVDHYFGILDKNHSKKISYDEFEMYFVSAIKQRNIKI